VERAGASTGVARYMRGPRLRNVGLAAAAWQAWGLLCSWCH